MFNLTEEIKKNMSLIST